MSRVQRLNAELNLVLADPDLRHRWQDLGVEALGGSPADAEARNEAETAKWSAVIDAAGIRME